jgi:2,4-didehydro-3-deoxy-L-rhamnonate hydrolase
VRFVNADGRAGFVRGDEVFDLNALSDGKISADPMTVLTEQWDAACELAGRPGRTAGAPVDTVDLGPPVPAPRAIFGLVGNWPPDTLTAPVMPMVFGKFPSSVTGPFADVVLPDVASVPMGREWTILEAELAIVIGRGGRRIPRDAALDAVAGLTAAQDITERVHEFGPAESPWTADYMPLKALGKSFDSFCPLGPAVVTLDELEDPNAIPIRCWLNGELVQEAAAIAGRAATSTVADVASATDLNATQWRLVLIDHFDPLGRRGAPRDPNAGRILLDDSPADRGVNGSRFSEARSGGLRRLGPRADRAGRGDRRR